MNKETKTEAARSQAETLMAEAFASHQAGELSGACECYLAVLALDPQHADAHYLLGVLASQQKQYGEAIGLIEKAIALRDDEPIYHANLGNAYKAVGRWAEAEAAYERALALRPDDAKSLSGLGQALQWLKRHQEAFPRFQAAIALEPAQIMHFYHFAMALQDAGMHSQAIAVLEKGLALDPGHAESHRNLGLAYQMSGKPLKALAHYLKARENLPEDAALCNNLGNIYRQLGRLTQAAECLQKAVALEPERVESYYNLGAVLEQDGKGEAAIKAFEAFLARRPRHDDVPRILCHIGRIYRGMDRRPRALACYEAALKINPQLGQAYNEAGLLFLELNQASKAILCFERSLVIDPDRQQAQIRLAYSQQTLGELEAAEKHFQAVIDGHPDHLLAQLGVAGVESERGHFDRAVARIDQVLARHPDQLEALAGKANALEKLRRYDEAWELVEPLVERGLIQPTLAAAYGTLCLRKKHYAEGVAYLEKVLASLPDLHFRIKWPIHFRLGELYDKLSERDKSFAHFASGNALKPHTFNLEGYQRSATATLDCFTPAFLASMPRVAPGARPVFIVGMPRSGTTLTEQILCSHPDVWGGGELAFLGEIWRDLIHDLPSEASAWQAHLAGLPLERWQELARSYLDQTAALASRPVLHITDKMPSNFQLLGLIEILFPDAVIVHCQRHPLDTCLSCFTRDFNHLEYTNKLEHLGAYYRSYLDLMDHWRAVSSLQILEMRYEETIQDQEAASRRLVAHAGLDWNEACLSFYETERFVKTASYEQVRNPIYTSSVARYKPYEQYLGVIKELIGPEALG
ncbi:MAG TPA: tetratricopeptide repeat protein [Candidatus Obscuribacterales bacterium]